MKSLPNALVQSQSPVRVMVMMMMMLLAPSLLTGPYTYVHAVGPARETHDMQVYNLKQQQRRASKQQRQQSLFQHSKKDSQSHVEQQQQQQSHRQEQDLDLITCRLVLWHALSVDILQGKENPLEIPGQLKARCEDGLMYDLISSLSPDASPDSDVSDVNARNVVTDEETLLQMYFGGTSPTYGLTEITIPRTAIVPPTPPIPSKSTKSSSTPAVPQAQPQMDLSKAPIYRQTLQRYDEEGIPTAKASASGRAGRDVTTGVYTVAVIRLITGDDAPTASAAQLADDVFGTESDVYNLKSGYASCSGSKIQFEPGTGTGLVNGVHELTIPENTYGLSSDTVQYYAENALSDSIRTAVDYLMYVFPANVEFGGAAAYAYLPGTTSFYADTYASTYIVQMHEIGHNLGHHHSGYDYAEYGDYSCWMGAHSWEDEGPDACFNGPKSYWFGWYSNLDAEPSSSGANVNLVGINDFINGEVTSSDHVVVLRLKDGDSYFDSDEVYVYYNKKEGVNSGVAAYGNTVTVTTQPGARQISWHEAALNSGEVYRKSNWASTGKDLVIEVCSMTSGTPDVANVIAYVEDISIAYCTPPEPTVSPAPSTSPAPTTLDVGPSIVINNGLVMLGINREGHLHAPGPSDSYGSSAVVGLRYRRDSGWYDSLSYGCHCEGYGVSGQVLGIEGDDDGYYDDGHHHDDYYVDDYYNYTFDDYYVDDDDYPYHEPSGSFWGGAMASSGVFNVYAMSFLSNGVYATSTAMISALKVTHHFEPSPVTDNLYQVSISYTNMLENQTVSSLRYRRVLDWDIVPDLYSECVSIFYDSVPSGLEFATDNGFDFIDPLDFSAATSGILFSCPNGTSPCPVLDSGPADHGALLQFLFRNETGDLIELAPGETFSFDMFIGAASTKAEADAALGQVEAEVATYAYPPTSYGCDASNPGSPNVYIVAFKGVGGSQMFTSAPSMSPLPSSQPSISLDPSTTPTERPSPGPSISLRPSSIPSLQPSSAPSVSLNPSTTPSANPSLEPSVSKLPSSLPTQAPSEGLSSVVISNDLIKIGLHAEGHLNPYIDYDYVGLRYFRDGWWYEAVALGCLCEGFGVSARSSDEYNIWGGANADDGVDNIVSSSLQSDGTYATSQISVSNALEVTHDFHPSPVTDNLYQVRVTYKNMLLDESLTELRYRRVVDWDVPPSTMYECVSILFNEVPTSFEYATDDGFESINPLYDVSYSGIDFSCPSGDDCPVYGSGPLDHGALLQFMFKNDTDGSLIELGPGETFSFDLFYGAAGSLTEAHDVLGQVEAEAASFGYPPNEYGDCDPSIIDAGSPNVFILGFKGVGGSTLTKMPTAAPTVSSQPSTSSSPTMTETAAPTDEMSAAIINNGVVKIGVNKEGHLNAYDISSYYDMVGIRYWRDEEWYESVSHGCACEGFGVSAQILDDVTAADDILGLVRSHDDFYYGDDYLDEYNIWGGAHGGNGVDNLSFSTMLTDGTEHATTSSIISDTLRITHKFMPSIHENLYKVTVTYENILDSLTLTNLRYRRVIDWDIPPEVYNECVSLFYETQPSSLEYASDGGFTGVNPLEDASYGGIEFSCPDGGSPCPVYDSGPNDHGALFQFLFKDEAGDLVEIDPGETFSFDMFIGAAASKADADEALNAVGAEITSFGYSPMSYGCDISNPGSPNVFMIAFRGVSGTPPEPTSLPTSFGSSSTPSPTPGGTDSCIEDVTFFYRETYITCQWIGEKINRMGKYCPKFEVRRNCPISCGHCCVDKPRFTFKDEDGVTRDCSWAGREDNKNEYCRGPILMHCPESCGTCWGSETPVDDDEDNSGIPVRVSSISMCVLVALVMLGSLLPYGLI